MTKRNESGAKDNPAQIRIFCEGRLTEPNYFNGLKRHYNLTNVKVFASRAGDIGPLGLLDRVDNERREVLDADEVYCVLDHDGRDHEMRRFEERMPSLRQEYEEIAQGENISSPIIKPIISTPCFEYWLLLHYQFTDMPFSATQKGGKSACDQVIKLLRTHIPNYKKNDQRIFERCRDKIDTAISHAARAKEPSPSCAQLGSLVSHLRRLQ